MNTCNTPAYHKGHMERVMELCDGKTVRRVEPTKRWRYDALRNYNILSNRLVRFTVL